MRGVSVVVVLVLLGVCATLYVGRQSSVVAVPPAVRRPGVRGGGGASEASASSGSAQGGGALEASDRDDDDGSLGPGVGGNETLTAGNSSSVSSAGAGASSGGSGAGSNASSAAGSGAGSNASSAAGSGASKPNAPGAAALTLDCGPETFAGVHAWVEGVTPAVYGGVPLVGPGGSRLVIPIESDLATWAAAHPASAALMPRRGACEFHCAPGCLPAEPPTIVPYMHDLPHWLELLASGMRRATHLI